MKNSFTKAHRDNRVWDNELTFYRHEASIFQSHLEEMVSQNTSLKESGEAQEFMNQFARFQDSISQLQNELNEAENKMAMFARSNTGADLDQVLVADHQKFGERIRAFKQDYLTLKESYKAFESGL